MRFLRGLIAGGVRNPVLANLGMVCILAGGLMASRAMVREAFPEFSLDHLTVEVAYPGASPTDVEHAICGPVEEAVRGIQGVRDVVSLASQNTGSVWLALSDNVDDPRRVLDEVKERVDQITIFPAEAEKPVVKEIIIRAEVISIAISGETEERTLKRYAQEVRDDLQAFPEISQIRLAGVRDDEIAIEVSRAALRKYGLTLGELLAVVAQSSLDLPAGVIRTAKEEVTLRITGQRYAARDYEDLVVIEDPNAVVRLGDIASVREGFEETLRWGMFNGERAALVSVFKTPQEDSAAIARVVRDYVEQRQVWLPDRLRMRVWGDTSRVIDSMLSMLVRNGVMGIALVFVTLLLFLRLRYAVWVSIGIPIAFAGALVIMQVHGETINLLSIFALIMVSGIIVDDAIVLAESVHAHGRVSDTPETAAINGATRVALPVLGASVTTIIAFIPLLFIVGVMGRFIRVLPVVVIAAIVASAVEAFLILPTHLRRRMPRGVDAREREPTRVRRALEGALAHVIARWYRPLYRLALENRGVTLALCVCAFLIAGGLVWGGRLPLVLLPKEDADMLAARVRLAEGTPAEVTERTITQLRHAARRLNEDPTVAPASEGKLVQQILALAGEHSGWLGFGAARGTNFCEVRIELMPAERRHVDAGRIIQRWRELVGEIHDATQFTIRRHELGPTDRPIEIRLLGRSIESLADASERIQAKLREFAGVANVHDDLIPGKRELQVRLRPAARSLGLTLDDVATHLRYGFFGGEAVTLQRGRDQVKVRIRYPGDERRSVADLENERIRTSRGDEIPFPEVADVVWVRGYANIWHQDGKLRVRVNAELDEGEASAGRILDFLAAGYLDDVVGDYNDMSYVFGGDRKRMDESLASLGDGFVLAVLAIYAVLASLLRSYVQPVVIVLALPFGLIGVIVGHVLLGLHLTLMSLFGAVALSGVVVNDSLVLVDAINGFLRGGMGVREAVAKAGEARFRAVVLTSLTTVAGLLPLLLERSSHAHSVMPMAVSLVFGILFATVLTLFVVPATFLVVNDARRFLHWLRYGGVYPAPELVENAAHDRLLALE